MSPSYDRLKSIEHHFPVGNAELKRLCLSCITLSLVQKKN